MGLNCWPTLLWKLTLCLPNLLFNLFFIHGRAFSLMLWLQFLEVVLNGPLVRELVSCLLEIQTECIWISFIHTSYFVHIHIYFSRQWRYGRLFHSRCRTWSLLNFEAPVSLFLQSIELPLKKQPCFPAYWSPIFSYFSIIYKPAESALCPIVWAVNRDIKQYWPKYQSLTNW